MPYDIGVPTMELQGNMGVVTFSVTRDGQPYCDGVVNYHAMSQEHFDSMKADMVKVVSKQKMKDVDYKGLRKVEKAVGKMLDDWAEKHEKSGKGK